MSDNKIIKLEPSRGMCCRCFVLSMTLNEARNLAESIKGDKYANDMNKTIDMLIPLGKLSDVTVDENSIKQLELSETGREFYTCKHFKDGDCLIYDRRPMMCRNYSRCEHPNCLSVNCPHHVSNKNNLLRKEEMEREEISKRMTKLITE